MGDEFDFLPADKYNKYVFYKMIVLLLMYVARPAQSTQNKKFAISLQYLKENSRNEVHFLPAIKY